MPVGPSNAASGYASSSGYGQPLAIWQIGADLSLEAKHHQCQTALDASQITGSKPSPRNQNQSKYAKGENRCHSTKYYI